MSLVLVRRDGEAVILLTSDGEIRIVVRGSKWKLAIEAEATVVIVREELMASVCEQRREKETG